MTATRDVAPAIRKVAELRRLCLRLPHLTTAAEEARLARFAVIEATPAIAGPADVDAIGAGWEQWWRAGNAAAITRMAARLPRGIVDADRTLSSLRLAAQCLRRA